MTKPHLHIPAMRGTLPKLIYRFIGSPMSFASLPRSGRKVSAARNSALLPSLLAGCLLFLALAVTVPALLAAPESAGAPAATPVTIPITDPAATPIATVDAPLLLPSPSLHARVRRHNPMSRRNPRSGASLLKTGSARSGSSPWYSAWHSSSNTPSTRTGSTRSAA